MTDWDEPWTLGYTLGMARTSFREQVLQAREDAIVTAVNRLLAQRGYEGMTIDAVAAEVGIAKVVLYKHFSSKESLAAAAMVRVLQHAQTELDRLQAQTGSAWQTLRGIVAWAMQQQLAGDMPALPSQNSALRHALMADQAYVGQLMVLSDGLSRCIEQAQAEGDLNPALPVELVLYTLFARACDPVLALMKAGGQHSDEQLMAWLLDTSLGGLRAPAAVPVSSVRRSR